MHLRMKGVKALMKLEDKFAAIMIDLNVRELEGVK